LNVGCGTDIRPASEGWTNLDGFLDHPEVVRHDVLDLPLPFPDNHLALVYASHVLEHVPVLFRDWRGTQRDVLFALMEDLHRILEPAGKLHIRVPLGGTAAGLSNPQHYRQWRPEWFGFFDQRHPEARYHAADFRLERLTYAPLGYRWPYLRPQGSERISLTQRVAVRLPFRLGPRLLQPRHEMDAVLVARK
jgi:predicted SAM-dependent methyltransferase